MHKLALPEAWSEMSYEKIVVYQLKTMIGILSQMYLPFVTVVCHANMMWSACLLNGVKQK